MTEETKDTIGQGQQEVKAASPAEPAKPAAEAPKVVKEPTMKESGKKKEDDKHNINLVRIHFFC
jgi:hypothetical protein